MAVLSLPSSSLVHSPSPIESKLGRNKVKRRLCIHRLHSIPPRTQEDLFLKANKSEAAFVTLGATLRKA